MTKFQSASEWYKMPLQKESKAKENGQQWVKTEIHQFFDITTAVNISY
jgi:hypothetical protein